MGVTHILLMLKEGKVVAQQIDRNEISDYTKIKNKVNRNEGDGILSVCRTYRRAVEQSPRKVAVG